MSGCWRRLRQGSERELPERAALFLHPVHLRGELSRAARGGWQRLSALHGVKGVFSFRREYPLLIPQRKTRGVPLDPRIGSRALEGVRSLRSVGACCFLYLNDLVCSYLRCCAAVGSFAALRMRHTPCGCRFACASAVFSNFRLLWILSDLQVPAKARHCFARRVCLRHR